MNDTQKAIAFLTVKAYPPFFGGHEEAYFTVEEIHSAINATCGIPALARNLRRYRANGTLISRNRINEAYKEYAYNPAYEVGMSKDNSSVWSDIKEWLENM